MPQLRRDESTSKSLLYEFHDYAPINSYEKHIAVKTKVLGDIIDGATFMVDKTSFIGLEVEVENIHKPDKCAEMVSPFWAVKADGSLRNKGVEFVTPPIRGENIQRALKLLEYTLYKYEKPDFSERTSVHVHVNVRKLSVEQLLTFIFTYAMVEKTLFTFINSCGFDRSNNIFCVPITDSRYYLPFQTLYQHYHQKNYQKLIYDVSQGWKKYTAFNLLPIQSLGTIEFRHMGGTADFKLLTMWINFLLRIKQYTYRTSLDDLLLIVGSINTNSQYVQFLEAVFRDQYLPLNHLNCGLEIEECVSDIKEAILLATQEQPILTKEILLPSSFTKSLEKVFQITLEEKPKNDLPEILRTTEEAIDAWIREASRPEPGRPYQRDCLEKAKVIFSETYITNYRKAYDHA